MMVEIVLGIITLYFNVFYDATVGCISKYHLKHFRSFSALATCGIGEAGVYAFLYRLLNQQLSYKILRTSLHQVPQYMRSTVGIVGYRG